jgi:hypothetical protein
MAIGTAVKKVAGIKTRSEALPPQAILQDRDTFIDASDTLSPTLNIASSSSSSSRKLQRGPLTMVITVFVILFYIFLRVTARH